MQYEIPLLFSIQVQAFGTERPAVLAMLAKYGLIDAIIPQFDRGEEDMRYVLHFFYILTSENTASGVKNPEAVWVCSMAYAPICVPSGEMVMICKGMSLPLCASAFCTAKGRPPQQGTVIRTTVMLLMSLQEKIWVSFSL